ncbi:MAG: hypothetical protein QE285_19380 [Aquabacterium sp.]|nr:hypothetical protein [Aquabacterium sp.]
MTRRLHLELAPDSWRLAARRTPAGIWAMGLIGLGCLAAAAATWWRGEVAHSALQQQIAATAAHMAVAQRRQLPAPVAAITPERRAAVDAWIAGLNVPWSDLFSALQAAGSPTIGLIELTAEARKRSIRLVAEARDTASMLAYVERLRAGPMWSAVALVSHQQIQEDAAEPVLRFDVQLNWQEGWR